jgi:hypothetical protein
MWRLKVPYKRSRARHVTWRERGTREITVCHDLYIYSSGGDWEGWGLGQNKVMNNVHCILLMHAVHARCVTVAGSCASNWFVGSWVNFYTVFSCLLVQINNNQLIVFAIGRLFLPGLSKIKRTPNVPPPPDPGHHKFIPGSSPVIMGES